MDPIESHDLAESRPRKRPAIFGSFYAIHPRGYYVRRR